MEEKLWSGCNIREKNFLKKGGGEAAMEIRGKVCLL